MKSLSTAQIGLPLGFNSNFPRSITAPLTMETPPGENESHRKLSQLCAHTDFPKNPSLVVSGSRPARKTLTNPSPPHPNNIVIEMVRFPARFFVFLRLGNCELDLRAILVYASRGQAVVTNQNKFPSRRAKLGNGGYLMRWKQMVNPPWPSVVALVTRTSCVHLKENWKSGV